MKSSSIKFWLLSILLPAFLLAAWLFMTETKSNSPIVQATTESNTRSQVLPTQDSVIDRSDYVTSSSRLAQSPFGKAPVLPHELEIIRERRKRMLQDGYATPEKYDFLNLDQLTKLSEIGDFNALIQMAERYSSEWDSLQFADGVVDTDKPGRFSETLMLRAVTQMGSAVIPLQVARSLRQGNAIDAYAWDALGKELNAFPGKFYQRESAFNNMNDSDRTAALRRLHELRIELRISETDEAGDPVQP